MDNALDTLRLRPHHLFCRRYQLDDEPDTDNEFGIFGRKIRKILQSGTKTPVIVTEGVDDLCAICSHNKNCRCENPHGDEEKTRRWDSILLDNLGISYGDRLTAGVLRSITDEKAPLPFCISKCKLRERCSIHQK
jgi:hypothetical protein